ncbi:prepilin-type N-terminal cleavage/methylation domain-containing protein [Companilactobacillus furfuricola]
MMPRKAGFTLIEAILTLFIFSSLVIIGAYQVKDYQTKNEEKNSIETI